MTPAFIDPNHLSVLVDALGAAVRGELGPYQAALADIALKAARESLAEARHAAGEGKGKVLDKAPLGRAPLFLQLYMAAEWSDDRFKINRAFELEAATRAALPGFRLGGSLAPFFADDEGWYGRALDHLNEHGFDTLRTENGFAVYAPFLSGAPARTAFRRASAYGSRPN